MNSLATATTNDNNSKIIEPRSIIINVAYNLASRVPYEIMSN